MSQVAGLRDIEVLSRRLLETLKQFSAGSDRGNLFSIDTAFQIARYRFSGADTQTCLRVCSALAHHDGDVRKLITFFEHQRLDFFGNRSDFKLTIAALEIAQAVSL